MIVLTDIVLGAARRNTFFLPPAVAVDVAFVSLFAFFASAARGEVKEAATATSATLPGARAAVSAVPVPVPVSDPDPDGTSVRRRRKHARGCQSHY